MFSNEDDDCMTFFVFVWSFLDVVDTHTRHDKWQKCTITISNMFLFKWTRHVAASFCILGIVSILFWISKFSGHKTSVQLIVFISKLDSSYRNILKLNVLCVYSIWIYWPLYWKLLYAIKEMKIYVHKFRHFISLLQLLLFNIIS